MEICRTAFLSSMVAEVRWHSAASSSGRTNEASVARAAAALFGVGISGETDRFGRRRRSRVTRLVKTLRRVCFAAAGTSVLGFGGCLGLDLNQIIRFGAAYSAAEFLLDNDAGPLGAISDVFGDGP